MIKIWKSTLWLLFFLYKCDLFLLYKCDLFLSYKCDLFFLYKCDIFFRVFSLWKLIYKMYSLHNIDAILLKLALNPNQSINHQSQSYMC